MAFSKGIADVLFMKGEYEKAAELYLEGAKEGEEIASYNYAYCLLNGLGVEQDFALAKSFFSYARDMKGGESCYNLALLYLDGKGVEKDYRTAMQYMSDAADLGCVEAMLYLGMAYTTGYVLYPEVIGISMIPYHKSEIRGEDVLLLDGGGYDPEYDEEMRFSVIRPDQRRAFEYFRDAAYSKSTYVEDLVARGKYLYAKCYIDGMGVDFNRIKGMKLMLAAGKSGSLDAVSFLAESGVNERLIAEWSEASEKSKKQ